MVLQSKTVGITRAKVVMLGAPGVGKSSLVRQYVHSIFSDTHKSTLGVKVDRKTVEVGGGSVAMLLWDMHGETEGLVVPPNYLKGTAAAVVVLDSSRPETISTALTLAARVVEYSPDVALYYVANKSDLEVDWPAVHDALGEATIAVRTSAKTGDGVETLFTTIARGLI